MMMIGIGIPISQASIPFIVRSSESLLGRKRRHRPEVPAGEIGLVPSHV
jgi:hypothetical protein